MNSWSKYAFYKSFRIHEMVTEWKNKHSKLKFNGPLEKTDVSFTEEWVFDGLYHLRDIFKFVRKKTIFLFISCCKRFFIARAKKGGIIKKFLL